MPGKILDISWNQVAAFRLARHHLLVRAPARNLVSVAGDMAGAQAQLLPAAKISLWSRVRDLRVARVDEALDRRLLTKAACMRRTLFLVPSGQLAIFVRGSARRAEKELRWTHSKGVPDRVVDAAIDAVLGGLDQPRTRQEIAQHVSQALGVQFAGARGGGWGSQSKVAAVRLGEIMFPVVYLLQLVSARGVVCYGPNRGHEPTFVRADAWIPEWRDISQEEAEDSLLGIYLRAYGPATSADFAAWAGINLSDAREIWARGQAAVAPVNVEGWQASVLKENFDELAQAGLESPHICLLPYFDSYLLGHKDRKHLVAATDHPKVYRKQGWIAPVVLVDGRVAGVWEHARKGNRLDIKVTKFEPLSPPIQGGIAREARDLGRFLGSAEVDVRVD